MLDMHDDHFGGGSNLNQGCRSGDNDPILEELLQELQNDVTYISSPSRNVYVDINYPNDDSNGTLARPFTKIQDALDYVDGLGLTYDDYLVEIRVEPGIYPEELIYTGSASIHLNGGYFSNKGVRLGDTKTGTGLLLSNATRVSLDAARAAPGGLWANYSMLVNNGSGFYTFIVTGFIFDTDLSSSIEAARVKGDDTPTTTKSCLIDIRDCNIFDLCRFKNISSLNFYAGTYSRVMTIENSSFVSFRSGSQIGGDVTASYDAASPDGTPSTGNGSFVLYFADGLGPFNGIDITCTGIAAVKLFNSELSGNLDINTSGTVTFENSYIKGNVTLDGAVVFNGYNGQITGTFTADAGAGAVNFYEMEVIGRITDAGAKIVKNGNYRRGVYTEAAGAGDRAIAFAPVFPAGSTVIVTLAFEDTGGGYQTGYVKNASLTVNGFNLMTGGNGKFHWTATKIN